MSLLGENICDPQPDSTVFVIDDDPALTRTISIAVESAGLKVACFGSAGAFLDAYDSPQAGCLILDFHLPNMSGLELLPVLKNKGIDLPVIMLTADARTSIEVQAIKAGAFDFLRKPVKLEFLLGRVLAALVSVAGRS